MTRRFAIGAGIAIACNTAGLVTLGYFAWDAQSQLWALRPHSADTTAIIGDPDEPAVRISALERRLDAIETLDPADDEARRLAQDALEKADAAQSKADDAYRRALDICIVHRIC